MDMSGEQRIPAPQQQVWDALYDPEVLKLCIPGCESVEKTSETEFTAKVVVAVGPVKAKFSGDVSLEDIDAPNGCTISGKGNGGIAGFGKGNAKVLLRSEGGETVLTYTANASVGGKIAQIGARLVDSTAKKLADEFFKRFVKLMTDRAPTGA
jgi:carbon monoxide dehydrogenase subunit G